MVEHAEELSLARKEACQRFCAVSHETSTRSNRIPMVRGERRGARHEWGMVRRETE